MYTTWTSSSSLQNIATSKAINPSFFLNFGSIFPNILFPNLSSLTLVLLVYQRMIEDAPKFMREIFGTNREYTTSALMEYFKSIIVSGFTNVLGEAAMSALDLPAKLLEFGDHVKHVTDPDFDAIGVAVVNLKVESVALPEEVEKAIDQRSSLGAMSGVLGEFTQYQTAQAIRDAANNPNGGMASAGVGLGAGVAIGQAMGQAMGQALNNNNNNQNNFFSCH